MHTGLQKGTILFLDYSWGGKNTSSIIYGGRSSDLLVPIRVESMRTRIECYTWMGTCRYMQRLCMNSSSVKAYKDNIDNTTHAWISQPGLLYFMFQKTNRNMPSVLSIIFSPFRFCLLVKVPCPIRPIFPCSSSKSR